MSRAVVHKSVKNELLEKLAKLSKSLKVGAGYEGGELTPVISEKQLQKVENYARSGVQAGAEAVAGGKRLDRQGYFFEATVFDKVKQDMTIANEEIFGPVLSVIEYQDPEEAIKIANDSNYGLVSYVWSTDIRKIMRAQAEIKAGVVWVNTPLMRELRAPFGGYKHSGVGRDGGEWSRNLFTEEKTVSIPLNEFPIAKLGI
jgi:acyl-CoA reductase-like NAD-dependent aldehyde dehydrogenase